MGILVISYEIFNCTTKTQSLWKYCWKMNLSSVFFTLRQNAKRFFKMNIIDWYPGNLNIKILNKVLENKTQKYIQLHIPSSKDIYFTGVSMIWYAWINYCNKHINQRKDKCYMLIWRNAKKAFDKIEHLSLWKTCTK